jgi:hypothetical protein
MIDNRMSLPTVLVEEEVAPIIVVAVAAVTRGATLKPSLSSPS